MRRELALLTALGGLLAVARAEPDAALIAQGRQVYVAEGCMHCHSQYVRPGTADEERYGAPRPLAELEQQRPPLFGNRRQGPDLQNVGSRRPSEWLRLQLQAPRTVMPGSRMPAYGHLFANGRADGDALVAYLLSLTEPAP